MPRNVRNFWLELDCDGSSKQIATGPKASGGGFSLTVRIRENGEVSDRTVTILGEVMPDGSLEVVAIPPSGCKAEGITLIESKR